MSNEVVKAETSSKRFNLPKSSKEVGQPRIITSGYFVQESKKTDLVMPRQLFTYDSMAEDSAIFNSVDITNLHVVNALYNGKFVPKGKSRKSKIAADFLNYCIRNMSYGTWYDAMANAATDLQYGFSLMNIVLEKRTYGKYKGAWCIKKLSPRDQKSVYGWLWDKDFREVKGFVQRPNVTQSQKLSNLSFGGGISELSIPREINGTYPVIKSDQLLHFTYNSTLNNPQGHSPLFNCYSAWKEKKLIEQFQLVSVSKGYGGALILRVPSELIEKAELGDDAAYAEYTQLQQDAAKFNSGESAYIVLTSDTDEVSKKYLYDVEFKGVEGSLSEVDTTEIIKEKQKAIYNCFGTSFLLLGQDGVGSYNLSTTGTSTHGYYVERNIIQKVVTIENSLMPKLLAANNIHLDWDDMPFFAPADPEEFDLDILSKFIQRVGSVNKLTPEVQKHLFEKAKLPIDGIEELDFTDKGQSRAGESQGTSGTGNTQQGGSTSSTNMENKSMRNLVVDGDKIIDSVTGSVVNLQDLDEEGNYK